MATRSITRLASAAVVTGIATLSLAAPASAEFARDGGASGGTGVGTTSGGTVVPVDSGWELDQIATGVLAGAALAGAGIAGAAGLRRHQHLAHPA